VVRLVAFTCLAFGFAVSTPAADVHGYGMSLEVPAGWHATISHGLVRLRGQGLRLMLRETTRGPRPDPFFRRTTVPKLRASDFRAGEHHLGFTLSERQFALLPSPGRASTKALAAVNEALRSFTAKPGNYYGQSLRPARFAKQRGWFAGARGGKLRAEGGQTETWAATVPYRDPPPQIPPHRTLARLPRDGIIIWLSLSRDSANRLRPLNSLTIRSRRITTSFEGLSGGIGLYRASVRKPGYDLDLWIFFKRVNPPANVIARAQAELDRLQLPTWPAG
jgi:hypothetical protein